MFVVIHKSNLLGSCHAKWPSLIFFNSSSSKNAGHPNNIATKQKTNSRVTWSSKIKQSHVNSWKCIYTYFSCVFSFLKQHETLDDGPRSHLTAELKLSSPVSKCFGGLVGMGSSLALCISSVIHRSPRYSLHGKLALFTNVRGVWTKHLI